MQEDRPWAPHHDQVEQAWELELEILVQSLEESFRVYKV